MFHPQSSTSMVQSTEIPLFPVLGASPPNRPGFDCWNSLGLAKIGRMGDPKGEERTHIVEETMVHSHDSKRDSHEAATVQKCR